MILGYYYYSYCRPGIFWKLVFFGILGKTSESYYFPKCFQRTFSPSLRDTQAMYPYVVTPLHVFSDVIIVPFCNHTSCGNWMQVLRTSVLAFLVNLLSLELVRILHLRIPKIRLFRKPKLAKFRKLHAFKNTRSTVCQHSINFRSITNHI